LSQQQERKTEGERAEGRPQDAAEAAAHAIGSSAAPGGDDGGLELVAGREQARQGGSGALRRRAQRHEIGFDVTVCTRTRHDTILHQEGKRGVAAAALGPAIALQEDRMANATGESGLLARIPADWLSPEERLGAAPVEAGMSDAAVFRIDASGPPRYLKIADRKAAEALRQEIARTRWLSRRGVRVPRLLRTLEAADVAAMLTAELPGVAIADCDRPIGDIVDIIARAFAGLHALPAAGCPFDESVAVRLERARTLIARGEVEPAQFEWRNRQLTPQQLYDRTAPRAPAGGTAVVVHGDATFDNMRIDAAGTLGLLDCGHAGRGDRYVDLERIASEVEEHFGAQWIAAFRRSYGIETWDDDRAAFFADLYELF
jgi:aminoglycoside 3'-phosphotransferase II